MSKNKYIRSPLRYPGGKMRVANKIISLIPSGYEEFRDPFVGGGSVFLIAKQKLNNDALYKINDLNYDLYCFWKIAQQDLDALARTVRQIKETSVNGFELYEELTAQEKTLTEFDRAVRFFILNRITFSGTTDSGGYSNQAFEGRFTNSSIDRLELLSEPLKNVEIYHGNYKKHLFEEGENVFIYLDPPYYKAKNSRLYGKSGHLNMDFDHEEFANNVKQCPHKWLITLDDSPTTRQLFNFAHIYKWEMQYGMNSFKGSNSARGRELFISNYELPISKSFPILYAK